MPCILFVCSMVASETDLYRTESAPAASRPAPTVIIVDDDSAVRGSLKFVLEAEGFAVRAYADGNALLAETELPRPACLVIDYRLPSPDGLELHGRLRGRNIDLPTIMITTQPSRQLRKRAGAAGVIIVEKPLLGDTLIHTVRRAFAMRGEH